MSQRIGSLQLRSSSPMALAAAVAQRCGFWGSVLLPISYLPVLYAMSGMTRMLTLTGLVVLNVLCLVAGRHYSP